jgi:hypothetical protein
METTKDQLVKTIKDWVKIDNEIRTLSKELQQRKAEKKKNSAKLMDIMKSNEIDCFDINDGQIYYSKRNIKKPITKKALLNILSNYYEGDALQANKLNEYIIENREEVVKETIERKIVN